MRLSLFGNYNLGGRSFKLLDMTYAAHILLKRIVCEKISMVVTTKEDFEKFLTQDNVFLLFTDTDWSNLFSLLLETGGKVGELTQQEFYLISKKEGEDIKKKLFIGFDFTKTASDYIDLLRGIMAHTSKLMKDSQEPSASESTK